MKKLTEIQMVELFELVFDTMKLIYTPNSVITSTDINEVITDKDMLIDGLLFIHNYGVLLNKYNLEPYIKIVNNPNYNSLASLFKNNMAILVNSIMGCPGCPSYMAIVYLLQLWESELLTTDYTIRYNEYIKKNKDNATIHELLLGYMYEYV